MSETSPYYITQAMLSDRVSAAKLARVMDDDNNGTPDTNPVTQLIQDAESHFESYVRGIYPLSTLRITTPPHEATRLCLDIAEAMLCRRFPKAASREWLPLWQATERELLSLRKGDTRLDVDGAPEPGANHGGDYVVNGYGLADEDYQPDSYTENGFGDF